MKFDESSLRLYAVTDRSWLGEHTLEQQVEQVLQGGATMIQLREKALGDEAFLQEARAIAALCRRYGVPFIVNDRVDLALACGADGVHVGQHDQAAGAVRRRMGDKILGVSAQTVEQALLAQEQGADYLGVGAVFHTGTKPDADDVSHAVLGAICRAVHIPVVAIGGIAEGNLLELKGSGVRGVAVVHALFGAPDPARAARRLRGLAEELVRP